MTSNYATDFSSQFSPCYNSFKLLASYINTTNTHAYKLFKQELLSVVNTKNIRWTVTKQIVS